MAAHTSPQPTTSYAPEPTSTNSVAEDRIESVNKRLIRPLKFSKFVVPLVIFTILSACGGDDSKSPNNSVSLYKYVGSLQCTGGGTSIPEMQQQLTDAGIQVFTATCGADGNMYPAACGFADGRIGIFEVSAAQAQAASALGFAPLSNLPTATKVACQ